MRFERGGRVSPASLLHYDANRNNNVEQSSYLRSPFEGAKRALSCLQTLVSPEQEALCERLEKGESTPNAAALIRQQAHEIDDLWDRLSRAYALVRRESPAEMIQEEMEQLRAMLDERRQLKKSG